MIAMYPVYHEHFTQKREQASMRAWSGEKCIKNYLVYLDRLARELHEFAESHTRRPMIISSHEQRAFDNATHCPRCNVQFTREGNKVKVREHCHITGNYRGPLCLRCNLH